MKQDLRNKKFGDKDLIPEDAFEPRNMKQRITTFVDMDLLDKLRAIAKQHNIGYQTALNLTLRNALERPEKTVFTRDDMRNMLMEFIKGFGIDKIIKENQQTKKRRTK